MPIVTTYSQSDYVAIYELPVSDELQVIRVECADGEYLTDEILNSLPDVEYHLVITKTDKSIPLIVQYTLEKLSSLKLKSLIFDCFVDESVNISEICKNCKNVERIMVRSIQAPAKIEGNAPV